MKLLIILLLPILFISCNSADTEINWEKNLSQETFKRAKKENKVILLNLEANWCHWCHVMHDSTYSNSKVIDYINENFIPIKVDQDATPELANRYRKYGWPATILISAEGEDIAKRAGYINRIKFLELLKKLKENPVVEKENSTLATIEITDQLENEIIQKLKINLKKGLDYKKGGFNSSQKYVDYEAFEYSLFDSKDPIDKDWVKISVEGAKKLSDPIWGGIYQYSTYRDWNHLHYEKLLSIQARYLKIFTQAYLHFNDSSSLIIANKIISYNNRFLKSSTGLYANAQDADLIQGVHSDSYFKLSNIERTKLGIPKIDTNTYTSNNAEMISSLLKLYECTGKKEHKTSYESILNQLLKRKNEQGLYSHSYKKEDIITLKDNLSMALALISLTKNKINPYEEELHSLMKVIKDNFVLENGAFKSFSGNIGLKDQPIVSENIVAARLFNWYGHYSKNESYINTAKKAYQFLITPEVAKTYFLEPGILSLQKEIHAEPKQFVILAYDSLNLKFSDKAKAMAPFYSIFKTYKPEELPSDKKDLFEGFEENVILVCTSSYCSSPIYDEKGVKLFFVK